MFRERSFSRSLGLGGVLFLIASALLVLLGPGPRVVAVAGNLGTSALPGFQLLDRAPEISARTLAELRGAKPEEMPKVWVYFTDKDVFSSEECRAALDEIRETLLPHAARRRFKTLGPGLVDFHDLPVPESHKRAVEALGANVVRESRWLNAVSVRAELPTLRAIAGLPFVQKLEPVLGFKTIKAELSFEQRRPPARSEADLFDYGPSRDQLEEINVLPVHAAGVSGQGIIVAMLDTGFSHVHPAFQQINDEGRLLAQWDFINDDGETMNEAGDDPSQHVHGTLTWSALGGFYEGDLVGPAYGASFLLAKTEDITSETPVEEDNWVAAAEWADQLGADVISSSLGYKDWYTYEDMDGATAVTTIGADLAVSRGIVVCNSAGNQGTQDWYYITAPADGDSVIAVGAVDSENNLAAFSSHGPTFDGRIKPEVVARGVETVCAFPEELGISFGTGTGTSLAAPLVAGSVALILEARPEWSPTEVRDALTMTADNRETPNNDRGWGRIDVEAAINDPVEVPQEGGGPRTPGIRLQPNPFREAVSFELDLPGRRHLPARLSVVDVSGRVVWKRTVEIQERIVRWNGTDERGLRIPAGVYFARLEAGDWQATAKLVLRD